MVLQYQLCPFAKVPFDQGKIRYKIFAGNDPNELFKIFVEEAFMLAHGLNNEIETTLVVAPDCFGDFDVYLGALEELEAILTQGELDDQIQVASFHPNYQFENLKYADPANMTNRSPFPIFHLLLVDQVSAAVDGIDDPEMIPVRNIETMRSVFGHSQFLN